MNRGIVVSYQEALLKRASTLEEKKFVRCLFPALWAANSHIRGYLSNTPIMQIYPPKLKDISSKTFRQRVEKSIASNYTGTLKDFQNKFWDSESVEDFIKSYTKQEESVMPDKDFINIRGDLVDQAKCAAEEKNPVGKKEKVPTLAEIIKKQTARLEESERRIKDIKDDLNADIIKIIKSFEQQHGIRIVEFECGGYSFDRKLGDEEG